MAEAGAMINRVAIAVGIFSCLVAIVALTVGLVMIGSSPLQGILLVGVGVLAMEGGVYLIRRARESSVLGLFSPALHWSVAVVAVAVGAASWEAGSGLTADDERPGWLPWAFYGIAGVCGWIGIRAAWHAISGPRKGASA